MAEFSIARLHLASFDLAGEFNPPSFENARAELYGYLISCSGGELVLVDTGIGGGVPVIDSRFSPERQSLIDALATHGVDPDDVRKVVNSHLHFDHCGNNRLFPAAEIFVQRRELELARELGKRYTVPEWFDYPGARLVPVTGDLEIADGVTLIATPGHTPGHQSVLIHTPGRRSLIAAQAAFSADEFERGGDPGIQAHEGFADAYRQSLARLAALKADEVLFSHDGNVHRLPR